MSVHILRGTHTLCDFSKHFSSQKEWPSDHAWVRWNFAKKATCVGCLNVYDVERVQRAYRMVRSRYKREKR